MTQILFYSVDNLGDLLSTTPTVRALRRLHPDAFLAYIAHDAGYSRILDGNPDIDRVLYRSDLARHVGRAVDEEWLSRLPLPPARSRLLHRFDMQAMHGADPDVFRDHISLAFARHHGVRLESVRPLVAISGDERARAASIVHRPYIVFGMYTSTPVPGADGRLVMKDWIFDRWLRLAREISAWNRFDVIALGATGDPRVRSRYFQSLYGLPIKIVAALLEGAASVVTVESGLAHLAHAVDAPMVLIFSKFVPYAWAYPREATRCRAIYDDPRDISCADVLEELEAIVGTTNDRRFGAPSVSAAVA